MVSIYERSLSFYHANVAQTEQSRRRNPERFPSSNRIMGKTLAVAHSWIRRLSPPQSHEKR